MIRKNWMRSAAAAKKYFASTDYYATCPGDWLGKGAAMLGLEGFSNQMHFYSLADNLDPRTGERLTAKDVPNRRVGIDLTFNSTKSVGIARELARPHNEGDPRIEQAHREAVAHTIARLESDMQCRVRKGGKNENRVTGNLVAYRVTHRDTRINADDQKPDMSLHDHVFVFNATYNPVEKQWKAAELGEAVHDLPYYEAVYHNRLAQNLKELGYGVRRKDKAFEIEGISDDLVKKFSRRTQYIEAVTKKLGIKNPESKAKLGATTRLGKATETIDDLNGYYVSRLTGMEKRELQTLIGRRSYQSNERDAVKHAIGHIFERSSVSEPRKVYGQAIRHGIGCVSPEAVELEAKRQGLIVEGRDASTKAVLAEEGRIIEFARKGKGTMRPLVNAHTSAVNLSALSKVEQALLLRAIDPEERGQQMVGVLSAGHDSPRTIDSSVLDVVGTPLRQDSTSAVLGQEKSLFASDIAALSLEQKALVSHILTSTDRVVLCVGDAGTGKTRSVRAAFDRIGCPVVMLAPTADASRGVLRDEGFKDADTVAAFVKEPEKAKNGVIWVDEAGMLPIRDLSRLMTVAEEQNARLVLQGDPKQLKSPARHGNMMRVLETYASLPVGRLTEIWRQKDKAYKAVVADIAAGKYDMAIDKLQGMGWIKRDNLVTDYLTALDAKKNAIIVCPTHAEGEGIVAELRATLKEEGKLSEEHTIRRLVPLHWTAAERVDVERYDGNEYMVFHQNSGSFKAGQVIRVGDWKPGQRYHSVDHFSVYRADSLAVADGDRIRITRNGKTLDGHRINNGAVYSVDGFDKSGNIMLANGWVLDKDFGHINQGWVSTAHAAQGKTVDQVFVAMGSQSAPVINAEAVYVGLSRAREAARVYTDMSIQDLKTAVRRTDDRKAATEVFKPKPRKLERFLRRARERLRTLQQELKRQHEREKERDYGR